MKKKLVVAIIVVILIISVIVYGIYIFLSNFKEDAEITEQLMNQMLNQYDEFNTSITEFSNKREELYNNLENTYLEDFSDNIDSWNTFINEYEDIITSLEENSSLLKENCFMKYAQVEVNSSCTTFKANYEAAMNYYITDINNYNEIVKEYNIWAGNNNKNILDYGHLPIYQEYIDFDQDGEYFGSDLDE